MLQFLSADLLRAAESGSPEPYSFLINYGALGIIVVLIVTGQLRSKDEVKRLEKQIEEQASLIKAFQIQLTTSTLPAMSKSAQVLEAIPEKESAMLEEIKNTQAQAREILSRLEKFSRPKGG